MFENRVLSRVFGPKRDEVTGEWRKLHKEELRNIYSLPSILRVVNWVDGSCGVYEGWSCVHKVIVGIPDGRRPLWRLRRRWENNIKMDLLEVGGVRDWMELAQDRDRWRALVNTVMNLRVP